MKRLMVLLAIVMCFVITPAFAEHYDDYGRADEPKPKQPQFSKCDKYEIYGEIKDCFQCHNKDMTLKEIPLGAGTPLQGMLTVEGGQRYATFSLDGSVNDLALDRVREMRDYLLLKPTSADIVRIDIMSGGGSIFAMWGIITVMDELKEAGYVVETRCRGFAASAAFVIFTAGTKGHRVSGARSTFMAHEVLSWEWFVLNTPSSLKDKARIFKQFQDNINEFLASVSKVSKKTIDSKMVKDEWWMTGIEAKKFGFVDKIIK